jgi:hypothetical protein
MTLTTVPTSIWRVAVTGRANRNFTSVFTTRDEARVYRSTLRTSGFSPDQVTTSRYSVSPEVTA